MKVVINCCYGGFSLSEKAILLYAQKMGLNVYPKKSRFHITTYWTVPESEQVEDCSYRWHEMTFDERSEHNRKYSEQTISCRDFERNDPILVQIVEELGAEANGEHAKLKVVEIPDDVRWEIDEYDGVEHVAEVHRTWS